ncbi:hypothetical protein PACTADRAFT_1067 [Pachysolen tannophilus NRRL Y-2460]|uniref:Thioesterase domain-containing protein n=1 Tax=Pachysolen tannophilus NRRL Y-2460 TaxID=669874 RepID=A0A1E4U3M3_PACTA|nr:hypothetical protein PACTADRAFT_1067 [Pachysolen tannophilus NRRL Y-2460]
MLALAFWILKWVFILISILSYKSVPFAYTIRFYRPILKNLIIPYYTKSYLKVKDIKKHELEVFNPLVYKTFCSFFECDSYLHKSNSTYFQELDICRADLMTLRFRELFWHAQDVNLGKKGKYSVLNWPYIPTATLSGNFKKEITPLARYHVISEVLCWDEKWLFVLSKFAFPTGKNQYKTCCNCITKYVFKNGRITIPPVEAMKICGLWNEKVEKISKSRYHMIEHYVNQDELDEIDLFMAEK